MQRLANLAQCSRSMLSLIESGLRRPSRALLHRLLTAIGQHLRQQSATDISLWSTLQRLRGLCNVRWTQLRTVEPCEYRHTHVYDLSVPGPETFLAGSGGLFVHNTYTIANVIAQVQRPTLVLAHNKTLAAQLYGELREYFPRNAVEYFVSYYDYYQPEAYVPSSDTYIAKDASTNEHIEQMRLSATKALLERSDAIIVATVSCIYGLGDPQAYLAMVLHLVRGERIDQRRLLRRLAEMQYTRNDIDLQPGTFRVRGDVIDIFPAESARDAVRVELFDDTIENLSLLDPLLGKVLARVPRYTVYPGTHYVTPRDRMVNALELIRDELGERLRLLYANNKLVEAQRLEQRTQFDLEMIREVGYCPGIENYSRYLSGREPGEPPPCLFDYLPPNALLVVDESHQSIPQLGAMYRGDRSRKETLVEYGFRLPSALDNRPLKFEEWERLAPQMIFVSATPGPYEHAHCGQLVEQVVRPTGLLDPEVEVRPASTQIDDVLAEIHRCVAAQERVLITTLTKRMAEDLTDYLHEHGVRVRYLHADIETVERVEIIRDLRLGKFDVLVGHQPAARGARHARGRAGGDTRCGQGRVPALGRIADPDHGPHGTESSRTRHTLRGPRHRLDAAGHGRDRTAARTAACLQPRASHRAQEHRQGGGRHHGRCTRGPGAERPGPGRGSSGADRRATEPCRGRAGDKAPRRAHVSPRAQPRVRTGRGDPRPDRRPAPPGAGSGGGAGERSGRLASARAVGP